MEFRPCIDIHNGRVKQIVGGSLRDEGDRAVENYVSDKDGAYYANLYREKNIKGGHVIMLNSVDSEYYEATKKQAISALGAYRGGLQIGGGINCDNAAEFLDAGASHVIVTSYVFKNGMINYENLEKLTRAVGKERLVLDLSCRKRGDSYYVVTDRWQKFTDEIVDKSLIERLSKYCDEFLIHAVDVEGKSAGIETELVSRLAALNSFVITYAGGIGSLDALRQLKAAGEGKINATIGSALDIFGGVLSMDDIMAVVREEN